MEIIAKKKKNGEEQTLAEHTIEVVKEALKLSSFPQLDMIAERVSISKEKLLDLIFYAAYFHDIGKATFQFQDTIHNKKKSYHPLYSASIVCNIKDFEFSTNDEDYLNLLLLIVMTHHSIYSNGLYSEADSDRKYQFAFLSEMEEFFYNYKCIYEKFIKKECLLAIEPVHKDLGRLNKIIKHELKEGVRSAKDKEALRLLYACLSGIINLADWTASAKFDGTLTKIEFEEVPNREYLLKNLAHSLNIESFQPKKFQNKMSQIKGNVLVEIPTGEGKTEGSLLWAINNISNIRNKIIYTLPTQTTSNKLFERVRAVFGDLCGLVHSSSKILLEKIYEEEYGEIDDAFKSKILFSTTFNKPVTVSTIDGVLKYFLNIGRYNISLFNILNSQIIIDEVHSYDFKMLGFLKGFIMFAQKYNIPICIMSASIPEKIKELLEIKHFQTVTDLELFSKEANRIIKWKMKLENDLENILSQYKRGKKVLIVRNTVAKSIETYEALKKAGVKNIILYNSQFKKKDRIKKESDIYACLESNESFILVATQVVEVSLDIDFHVMFTDLAPIDALIQRFGRVNRKKLKNRIGDIFIYEDTEIKPYEKSILDLTFETLKDGIYPISEYKVWLDAVYDRLFQEIKTENKLEKFRQGLKKFSEIISDLNGIEKSDDNYDLREIEYPKKDYILIDDYETRNETYGNTVSLGSWLSDEENGYIHAKREFSKGHYYDVLILKYSYETGVIFENKDDYERFL